MSESILVGTEKFQCTPYYRPSNQNCNQLPDEQEDQCLAGFQSVMDHLKAEAKIATANLKWQWKIADSLIRLEKRGISIFDNVYFIDWALNSSASDWDCQWDTE